MWVRKSKDELQEDKIAKSKTALKYAAWTFVISISLSIIKDRFIGTGGGTAPWGKPISWHEIHYNIFLYIVFSFLLALAAYKTTTYSKSSTQICNKCNKTQNKGKSSHCKCGGSFINIDWLYSKI